MPPYESTHTFNFRVMKAGILTDKFSYTLSVGRDSLSSVNWGINSVLETASPVIYRNNEHFFNINFTLKNALPYDSSIKLFFTNIRTQ